MRRSRKILLVLLLLLVSFAVYVEIVNRNTRNMTYRQKVLKAIYPVWMWWTNLRNKNVTSLTNKEKQPIQSFYDLKAIRNNGDTLDFSSLKGKKVLLVNTASDCGYTNQYADLQELHEKYKTKLIVLGFPANDFKEQEKGTDEEIASFCKVNFGVTFPLMQKSVVKRSDDQHAVYKWLTDSTRNGWNNKQPSWNFAKYIVNEEGILTHYFGSSISPLSKELIRAID